MIHRSADRAGLNRHKAALINIVNTSATIPHIPSRRTLAGTRTGALSPLPVVATIRSSAGVAGGSAVNDAIFIMEGFRKRCGAISIPALT